MKTSVTPTLDANAELILHEYFIRQRRSDRAESGRTTVRLLESLIRISEAHARLMARDVVCSQDAIVAIMLVQSSLNAETMGGVSQISALHQDFPEDPDKDCLFFLHPFLSLFVHCFFYFVYILQIKKEKQRS